MNKEIEKAIETLKNTEHYIKFDYEYLEIETPLKTAIDLAISALEAQQADRWIPVSDHNPEETGHYTVTVKYIKDGEKQVDRIFFAGKELDNSGWRDTYERYRKIVAWKTDEPWKEEQP